MYQALKLKYPDEDIPSERTVYRLMEEIGLGYRPNRKPNGITKADRDARKSNDLLKRDFTAGKPLEKCVTDIKDIYESWKATYFNKLSKKGVEGYETAWKRLAPIKDRKMRELKTSDYQELILNAQTFERKKKDGSSRPSQPLSKSGKEKIQQLCSQLCQFAMRDDIIDKNYAQMVLMPEDDTISKDIFTPEHIALLEAYNDNKTAQITLTLIYTGMRINELFSVERKNVHLEEHYLIGGLKTEAGKDRFIPICKKIMPYIEQWYQESICHELLLTNKKGGKMNDGNFRNRDFYPLMEQLGICKTPKKDKNGRAERRTLTPHSARQTFISMASAQGANSDLLTLIVGHEHFDDMCNTYRHLTEQDKTEIFKITDAI